MDIAIKFKTVGVCLAQAWEESFFPPLFSRGTITPAVVQRTLIDRMVGGIRAACDDAHLQLLLYPYSLYKRATAQDILANPIDGLILVSGFIDPRLDTVVNSGLPVVSVNRFWEAPRGGASVFCVEAQTVDLALGHLWERGHRRIAYVGGSIGPQPGAPILSSTRTFLSQNNVLNELRAHGSDTAVRRLERTLAWLERRRALNLDLIALTHERFSGEDRSDIATILTGWHRMVDPPTAIFCGYEGAAIQMLEAAHDLGIRVPEDLSLIGIDTDMGLMGQTDPPLTSVRWPAASLGSASVRAMLSLLKLGAQSPHQQSPVSVVDLFSGATTARRTDRLSVRFSDPCFRTRS